MNLNNWDVVPALTRSKARLILRSVWGCEGCLSKNESKMVTEAELPGETALMTLCRIAGIPEAAGLPAWDNSTRSYFRNLNEYE